MNYFFELKAEHGIDVNPGDYIETVLLDEDAAIEESCGRDEYDLSALLLPGKRVAGFARSKKYSLGELPAGLSAIEAEPSESISLDEQQTKNFAFRVTTNMILDQGLLGHYLSLGFHKDGGSPVEIPLNCPAVKIEWLSRGNYIVRVDAI